jgi:hypothetical protein
MTNTARGFPDPGSPVVPRANDVYSGMRLLYERGFEMIFLERRSITQLARVVMPCVVFATLVAAGAEAVFVAVGAFKDLDNDEQRALAASVGFVSFGVGFLLWSVRRQKIGIASWQVVVDDRAGASAQAIAQLRTEIDRRLSAVNVSKSEVVRRGQWALRIRLRTFSCYVSIFPFGSDLFVGWAMLEEPNFWNVFGGWVADLFRGGTWFTRETRSYAPKALRDVVHHATREAVAAAAAGVPAPRYETAAPPSAMAAPPPGEPRFP